jgi:hypothetical protein
MTGCYPEAQSRTAQSSGIRELWTVISPKFSTHFEFTTIFFHQEYDSSSPDADQLASPYLRQGRLRTARVLAPLCNCNNSLTINCILVQRRIVSFNSLPQLSVYQSRALPSPREQHQRYVHHRDTIGIQHIHCHLPVETLE